MRTSILLCLLFVCLVCLSVEVEARRGGGWGGRGRGGYGGRGDWGRGRSSYSNYRRPSYSSSSSYSYSRNYYGGGSRGPGLFGLLFGFGRNRGYRNYYNYNQQQGYCRVAQFVDYVGRTPRYFCDCPPYPPNYQWNQCVAMPAYEK